MILPSEVHEFQKIFKEVKGISLTYEEAEDQAERLITLLELMAKYNTSRKQTATT